MNTSVTPRVSAVVPAARRDAHLVAAVESLLAQTLPDLEVIVVLDGAPPGPPLPDDPRLRVHRFAERRGTPAALNQGLAMARGDYVARLDADDLAAPERLAVQVAVLDARRDLIGLGSCVTLIDQDDRRLGDLDVPLTDTARRLLVRNVFVHSAMLLRREALEAVGGYDLRCTRMQDYDLWLRLSRIGRLENSPHRLTSYRVHPGMHSRRTSPFGSPARTVRRSRRALAAHLGQPRAVQLARDAVWTGAQLVRHLGLRAPRYLRR
jgi:glycosyltransferase involved in cell wall biosynthesis